MDGWIGENHVRWVGGWVVRVVELFPDLGIGSGLFIHVHIIHTIIRKSVSA